MSKYVITYFLPNNTLHFNTDKYELFGYGGISFIDIPRDVKTTLYGSFMIEERVVYEKHVRA